MTDAGVASQPPNSSQVKVVYKDKPHYGRRGHMVAIDVDTDAGYVRQTYLHNPKTGSRQPHAICRHSGTIHHPDAAMGGGARSHYQYVLRADGSYERAWFRDHTNLMAAKGDMGANETLVRLFNDE